MPRRNPRSDQAVALVIVLALLAIMTMLAVTFFVSVSGERRASQLQIDGDRAARLATSASQMVLAQIAAAATRTTPGANDAVAWTSQPGLLRTFTTAGASTVYKLYSDDKMVTDTFAEDEDAPPADWKAQPGIYSDLNAPTWVSGGTATLSYPVANPAASGLVPGFTVSTAPGYDSGQAASPSNNPLPMPVRWLYVLKDGQIATPASVSGDGTVSFTPSGPQPSTANPVVGRMAFWADDETCKVNINTAGYAANNNSYSTYWDTPVQYTRFENSVLSSAQPWANEFLRYPGHPATTGLNVVFDDLDLTPLQTANLTPRYKDGGSKGGTVIATSVPTDAAVNSLRKSDRLYPTVDEFFYDPQRAAGNVGGISASQLEQRRFLLTANSRAPETTLFDTPRVTIWPTWETTNKRSPIDSLIAFCSTIANQAFYFVRENANSGNELLGIPANLALYRYLQELTSRPVPAAGGSFLAKYSPAEKRDQILTSIFDSIRLANLMERGNPGGWFFAGGRSTGGTWSGGSDSFARGFVAPTTGPSDTRGAGRTSTLAETAVLFARTSDSPAMVQDPREPGNPGARVRRSDLVNTAMLYGFATPSAGMIIPGQNRRIVVTGLDSFQVDDGSGTLQRLFPSNTFTNTHFDDVTHDSGNYRRGYADGHANQGGLDWTMSAQRSQTGSLRGFVPPGNTVVLPYDPADAAASKARTFSFTGGTLNIEVYSPANAPAPAQTFSVTFPPASAVLTPMPATDPNFTWTVSDEKGRFRNAGNDGGLSIPGDTILAMQSRTSDHRSEILRSGTISDFVPHARYGATDAAGLTEADARRASSYKQAKEANGNNSYSTGLFGSLLNLGAGANPYGAQGQVPALTTRPNGAIQSLADAFPTLDFANGPGDCPDGSWSPKSDEGKSLGVTGIDGAAYFRSPNTLNDSAQGTLSSPNRQMPSAVLFGSIPTATWRTLLFRPARAYHSGGSGHFGKNLPADWFLLDLFHMPIVEPYAISEPFSTLGKVNLNARVMPFFGYLQRETALHAVLRAARIVAIPENVASSQFYNEGPAWATAVTRHPVNEEETLAAIRERYTAASGPKTFLTAAEICSIDLVPEAGGITRANLASFWSNKRTTGDNSREAPYATLVPRLTTRSNSYAVHVTAQALAPGAAQPGWNERRGTVVSEWRGEITIERYVDPLDSRFSGAAAPDFLSGTQPVGPYYRFRVLGIRRFEP